MVARRPNSCSNAVAWSVVLLVLSCSAASAASAAGVAPAAAPAGKPGAGEARPDPQTIASGSVPVVQAPPAAKPSAIKLPAAVGAKAVAAGVPATATATAAATATTAATAATAAANITLSGAQRGGYVYSGPLRPVSPKIASTPKLVSWVTAAWQLTDQSGRYLLLRRGWDTEAAVSSVLSRSGAVAPDQVGIETTANVSLAIRFAGVHIADGDPAAAGRALRVIFARLAGGYDAGLVQVNTLAAVEAAEARAAELTAAADPAPAGRGPAGGSTAGIAARGTAGAAARGTRGANLGAAGGASGAGGYTAGGAGGYAAGGAASYAGDAAANYAPGGAVAYDTTGGATGYAAPPMAGYPAAYGGAAAVAPQGYATAPQGYAAAPQGYAAGYATTPPMAGYLPNYYPSAGGYAPATGAYTAGGYSAGGYSAGGYTAGGYAAGRRLLAAKRAVERGDDIVVTFTGLALASVPRLLSALQAACPRDATSAAGTLPASCATLVARGLEQAGVGVDRPLRPMPLVRDLTVSLGVGVSVGLTHEQIKAGRRDVLKRLLNTRRFATGVLSASGLGPAEVQMVAPALVRPAAATTTPEAEARIKDDARRRSVAIAVGASVPAASVALMAVGWLGAKLWQRRRRGAVGAGDGKAGSGGKAVVAIEATASKASTTDTQQGRPNHRSPTSAPRKVYVPRAPWLRRIVGAAADPPSDCESGCGSCSPSSRGSRSGDSGAPAGKRAGAIDSGRSTSGTLADVSGSGSEADPEAAETRHELLTLPLSPQRLARLGISSSPTGGSGPLVALPTPFTSAYNIDAIASAAPAGAAAPGAAQAAVPGPSPVVSVTPGGGYIAHRRRRSTTSAK